MLNYRESRVSNRFIQTIFPIADWKLEREYIVFVFQFLREADEVMGNMERHEDCSEGIWCEPRFMQQEIRPTYPFS